MSEPRGGLVVTYHAVEEGDSPLDGDGDGLQAVMVTGGLGLRF